MSSRKKDAGPPNIDFKSAMQSIEDLLKKLEDNDTPLEQSLEYFEQGVLTIRKCQALLLDAEQKVQLLMENDGDLQATPLPDDGGEQ